MADVHFDVLRPLASDVSNGRHKKNMGYTERDAIGSRTIAHSRVFQHAILDMAGSMSCAPFSPHSWPKVLLWSVYSSLEGAMQLKFAPFYSS